MVTLPLGHWRLVMAVVGLRDGWQPVVAVRTGSGIAVTDGSADWQWTLDAGYCGLITGHWPPRSPSRSGTSQLSTEISYKSIVSSINSRYNTNIAGNIAATLKTGESKMSISFKHSDTYHSRDIAKEFSEQNGITPDQAMSQSYQFHLRKMFDDVGIRLIQGRIYFHDGEGENNHARDVKNLKEFIADTATLVNHLSDAVDDIEAHYAKAQHEFREHFRSEYYEPESDKTFDEQYARFVELENS